MHEGFVNYNAGTLGASMVEGRISAGVVVGDGSDVGGGASIMGTLSGGGTEQITRRRALPDRRERRHRHLPRRRLRRRGRHVRHRRLEDHAAGRQHGQGRDAVRAARPAVPAQQRHRRARGPAAHGQRHRTQRRAARQRLSRADGRPSRAHRPARRGRGSSWSPRSSAAARSCTRSRRTSPPTTARSARYDLDTDQAVGRRADGRRGDQYRPALPERAAVLALMAGLQESKLRNLAPGEGDRDSVGVLQQRPSQGWGTSDAARLTDVTEATREFLAALVKIGWQTRSAGRRDPGRADLGRRQRLRPARGRGQALADALRGHKPAGDHLHVRQADQWSRAPRR